MRTYVARRLLLVIPTLFLVSVIIFSLMRIAPGDVVDQFLGEAETGTGSYSEREIRDDGSFGKVSGWTILWWSSTAAGSGTSLG